MLSIFNIFLGENDSGNGGGGVSYDNGSRQAPKQVPMHVNQPPMGGGGSEGWFSSYGQTNAAVAAATGRAPIHQQPDDGDACQEELDLALDEALQNCDLASSWLDKYQNPNDYSKYVVIIAYSLISMKANYNVYIFLLLFQESFTTS